MNINYESLPTQVPPLQSQAPVVVYLKTLEIEVYNQYLNSCKQSSL